MSTNAVRNVGQSVNRAVEALLSIPYDGGVDMVFWSPLPDNMMMLVRLEVANGGVTVSVQIKGESGEPLMTEADMERDEDGDEDGDEFPPMPFTTYDALFSGFILDSDYDADDMSHLSKDWRQAFKGDSAVVSCDVCSLDAAVNDDGHLNHETEIIENPACAPHVAAVKAALCR